MNRQKTILRRSRIFSLLTVLFLMFAMLSGAAAVMAEETDELNEKPVFTVRVYGGDQGTIGGAGVKEITDVKEGASVKFDLGSVQVKDARYYVKGIRVSGGGENNSQTYTDGIIPDVRHDTDYVVVYGMKRKPVAYTIQYLKADGSGELAASKTLYGKVGDIPVVASKHIEGYYPNARNLKDSHGLSDDPSNNVFRFWYQPMPVEVIQVAGGGWYGPGGMNGTGYAGGTNGTAFASGMNGTSSTGTMPLIPLAAGGSRTEAAGTGTAGRTGINGRTGMFARLGMPDRLPATPGEVPYMLDLANDETLLFAPGTNMTGIAGTNMTNTTDIAGMNMTDTTGIAGINMTNMTGIAGENVTVIAGENMTGIAGENIADAAGANVTGAISANITDAAGMNRTDTDEADTAEPEEEEVIGRSSGIPAGLLGGIIGAAAAAVIAVIVVSRKRR